MSARIRTQPLQPAGKQPDGPLNGAVCADGGLFDGTQYIDWKVGEPTVTLDSEFTAEDLEAIAAHMRAHSTSRQQPV